MKLPLLMGLTASLVLWADAFQQNPIGGQLRKVDTGVTPIVPSALFISHHGFETETKSRTKEIVRQHSSKGLQSRSIATSGLNLDTLKSIAFSQAAIVAGVTALTALSMLMTGHAVNLDGLHWNGDHAFVSPWNFDLSLERMFEGFVVAGPLIVIENILRASDNRDLSVVNLSTTNMVMTLFGRRRHQVRKGALHAHPTLHRETELPEVMLAASGISLLAGLSEELVFRAAIPAAIVCLTQSTILALFVQALLFGHVHISPEAQRGENKVMCGLQTAHGLWLGLAYLAFNGDVLPCVVAHALYDLHVFVNTWLEVNNQMDYTDEAVLQRLTPWEAEQMGKIQQEAGPTLTAETLAFARRFFYAFDYEHRGSLSESDVQRAVSYAFLQDKVQPTQDRVGRLFGKILKKNGRETDGSDSGERMELSEFLRLLFLLKANPQPAESHPAKQSVPQFQPES